MQKHREVPLSVVFSATSLFRHSRAHTFDCSACGAFPLDSRAADGGSAGAADGSSNAVLVLIAALAEHPHVQVERSALERAHSQTTRHAAALSCQRRC